MWQCFDGLLLVCLPQINQEEVPFLTMLIITHATRTVQKRGEAAYYYWSGSVILVSQGKTSYFATTTPSMHTTTTFIRKLLLRAYISGITLYGAKQCTRAELIHHRGFSYNQSLNKNCKVWNKKPYFNCGLKRHYQKSPSKKLQGGITKVKAISNATF